MQQKRASETETVGMTIKMNKYMLKYMPFVADVMNWSIADV